jgi:transcription elongation factor Elf1
MSADACPICGSADLVAVEIHDVGPHKVCQACGWRGPVPRDSNDDGTETDRRTTATPSESESRTQSVTCDRCSETVPLTRAITHVSVEDPDEVVCSQCIEPSDRAI